MSGLLEVRGMEDFTHPLWSFQLPLSAILTPQGGGTEDASRAPDMSAQVSTTGQARRSWKGGPADNGSAGACGT